MTIATQLEAERYTSAFREVQLDSIRPEEVLRSLPKELYPHSFKVTFSALDEHDDKAPFSSRVFIPQTRLRIGWDLNDKRFVPQNLDLMWGSRENREGRLSEILSGGIPQDAVFETSNDTSEALRNLIDKIAEMQGLGYHFHTANLDSQSGKYGPRSTIALGHKERFTTVAVHEMGAYLTAGKIEEINKWMADLIKLQ